MRALGELSKLAQAGAVIVPNSLMDYVSELEARIEQLERLVPDADDLFVVAGRLEAMDDFTEMDTSRRITSAFRKLAKAIREYREGK
jgi:hypothetical protein